MSYFGFKLLRGEKHEHTKDNKAIYKISAFGFCNCFRQCFNN